MRKELPPKTEDRQPELPRVDRAARTRRAVERWTLEILAAIEELRASRARKHQQ
jgi:hypothetical protein